jgi:hypothetical protein
MMAAAAERALANRTLFRFTFSFDRALTAERKRERQTNL